MASLRSEVMASQMSMTSTEFGQLTSGVPVAERGVWYLGEMDGAWMSLWKEVIGSMVSKWVISPILILIYGIY